MSKLSAGALESIAFRSEKPITFSYSVLQPSDFIELQSGLRPVALDGRERIRPQYTYRSMGLAPNQTGMFLRESVALRLQKAILALPEGYEFWVFDAFRTRETQLALFDLIFQEKRRSNPDKTDAEVYQLTREFVAHPDEVSRFPVAPHNSGGAVDLTLAFHGVALDMGTSFDDTSPWAATRAYEGAPCVDAQHPPGRWETVCRHRRLLFHTMRESGFVNYTAEWWHYDLGDSIWAQELGSSWSFPSMEEEVARLTARGP